MTTPPAYYEDGQVALYQGAALHVARQLPSGAANSIVTSASYSATMIRKREQQRWP